MQTPLPQTMTWPLDDLPYQVYTTTSVRPHSLPPSHRPHPACQEATRILGILHSRQHDLLTIQPTLAIQRLKSVISRRSRSKLPASKLVFVRNWPESG